MPPVNFSVANLARDGSRRIPVADIGEPWHLLGCFLNLECRDNFGSLNAEIAQALGPVKTGTCPQATLWGQGHSLQLTPTEVIITDEEEEMQCVLPLADFLDIFRKWLEFLRLNPST